MASDDELIQGMEQVSRACLTDRERRFVVEAIAEVRELRRDKARLAALCKWVSERDCEFSVEELIAIADEELAESTDKLRHAEAEIERLRADLVWAVLSAAIVTNAFDGCQYLDWDGHCFDQDGTPESICRAVRSARKERTDGE